MNEIPVYMFIGFLDSGKTRFIQDTLEDGRFNKGEKTLLLICEEGEDEYDPSLFAAGNVYIEKINRIDEINPENLSRLAEKHSAERVVAEYNGMWLLNDIFENTPESWTICQIMMFTDSNTVMTYNANMRNLVADKFQNCETVVFNRIKVGGEISDFHKLVRTLNRRCDIIYEYSDGSLKFDDIEDPLPFDINSSIINVEDKDYALFYRDINEEPDKYSGKTVYFKAAIAVNEKLGKSAVFAGRHVMTCCAADIKYCGMLAVFSKPVALRSYDWVYIKAKISVEKNRFYKGKGPVLKVISAELCLPPDEQVAAFY